MRTQIARLKTEVEARKAALQNGGLSAAGAALKPLPHTALSKRKTLVGHFNKVYALDWARDGVHAVTTGQDSRLIYWNAVTSHKLQCACRLATRRSTASHLPAARRRFRLHSPRPRSAAIQLKNSWAMDCALEPTAATLVATGGMDNLVSLYNVNTGEKRRELRGHDGYVSGVRFIAPTTLVSTSGDGTVRLWDVETGVVTRMYSDHDGDVLTVATDPTSPHIFVTGSVDATARVFDARAARAAQTFIGNETDVNVVRFMPCGMAFATATDDGTSRLFDLRAYARINVMTVEGVVSSANAADFSSSGRILFVGHDDCNVYAWDTMTENPDAPLYHLAAHSYRVSCLRTNPTGRAIATGSWDTEVAVRAMAASPPRSYATVHACALSSRVCAPPSQIWA